MRKSREGQLYRAIENFNGIVADVQVGDILELVEDDDTEAPRFESKRLNKRFFP